MSWERDSKVGKFIHAIAFFQNPVKLNIYFNEAFACSLTFSFSLSFSLSFYICPFCCWPGIEVGLIRKASRFYLRSVKPRKEKKLESERIVLSTFVICKGKEQKILTISANFITAIFRQCFNIVFQSFYQSNSFLKWI